MSHSTDSSSDQPVDELRQKICTIFGVFPEEEKLDEDVTDDLTPSAPLPEQGGFNERLQMPSKDKPERLAKLLKESK